ncbi:hypothetical protein HY256_07095 [Candidatus Sumerlaeota bacterium]|nr:hypothetical protein [Candidatus Sumerlaeota bacterium]
MRKLEGKLREVIRVTPGERDQMFALMDRYYLGMKRPEFEADLDEKQWVIQLIQPETGRIQGFSTQVIMKTEVGERTVKALFSGDTIIAPEYWANNNFIQVWGRFALSLMDAAEESFPPVELYWFLISKGYKTYRFLPVFFHEFYPRHDVESSRKVRRVIDALGRHKYPERYDPARGVICAENDDSCRLREDVAQVTPERLADPHVRFFLRRNPEHARGDELCCIAPLTRANFTRAAYRAIGPEPAPRAVSSCH